MKDKNDKSLTERQWARKGYIKNSDDSGTRMWTNQHCGMSVLYLSEQEVHEASPEELKTFWHPERQRQAKRKKELEEQRKIEAEREKQQIEAYIKRLEQKIRTLKSTVRELMRQTSFETEYRCDIIVLDLETTGLDYNEDEILQVSIIDNKGNTLYDSYIKPVFTEEWSDAERINHISPEMVQNAPNIYEEMPKINAILKNVKKIIGYNHYNFDILFLKAYGAVFPENAEIIDVMIDFAPIYGEYNEYYDSYKWQKLITCAAYYGYNWGTDAAHNSLLDCRAILYCYNEMKRREAND